MPKGINYIAIYFVVLAAVGLRRYDVADLGFAFIYALIGFRIWKLKADGRQGAIFLSWLNIILGGFTLIFGLKSVMGNKLTADLQSVAILLVFELVLRIIGAIMTLRYLKRPQVSALFRA